MNILNLRKKWLASNNWAVQIFGALSKWHNLLWLSISVVIIISLFTVNKTSDNNSSNDKPKTEDVAAIDVIKNLTENVPALTSIAVGQQEANKTQTIGSKTENERTEMLLELTALFIFCMTVISVCRTLTNIFSLRKQEGRITVAQIMILVSLGVLIIGFAIIINIQNHPRFATAIAIMGSVLTWIFQDTIKGVAAFLHLRLNHLLNIGDWIKVPQYNVDGQVRKVTLTTITVYNWDTTTSSIPTSVLTTNHFMNLQHMMQGKTFGRQMDKTFVFDQNWINKLSESEIKELTDKSDVSEYLSEEELVKDTLNIKLFRLYLLHWLMNHPHISHHPLLIVRWLDPVETGLPLQIKAFIVDSTLAAFEWQQSQIIEHIVESIKLFGLRLYQSPSSYDVSNSNIHLTNKAATYRNE